MLSFAEISGASESSLDEVFVENIGYRAKGEGRVRNRAPLIVVELLLVGISLRLSWLNVASFGKPKSYSLNYFSTAILICELLLAASIVIVLVETVAKSPRTHSYAVVPLGILMISFVFVLLTSELAGSFVPRYLMPIRIHRFLFAVSAGPGAWIGTVMVGLALYSCFGRGYQVMNIKTTAASAMGWLRSNWSHAIMLSALLLAFAGRYSPWMSSSVAGRSFNLQGWIIPWAGNFLLFTFVVWGLATIARRWLPMTSFLAVAAIAWTLFFGCLVVYGAASSIGRVRLGQLLGSAGKNLAVSIGIGFWLSVAAGILGCVGSLTAMAEQTRIAS